MSSLVSENLLIALGADFLRARIELRPDKYGRHCGGAKNPAEALESGDGDLDICRVCELVGINEGWVVH